VVPACFIRGVAVVGLWVLALCAGGAAAETISHAVPDEGSALLVIIVAAFGASSAVWVVKRPIRDRWHKAPPPPPHDHEPEMSADLAETRDEGPDLFPSAFISLSIGARPSWTWLK
jgi:hypothetical protein